MFRSRAQGEVTTREVARKILSRASVGRLDRNRNRGTQGDQYFEVRRLSESWNNFHAARPPRELFKGRLAQIQG